MAANLSELTRRFVALAAVPALLAFFASGVEAQQGAIAGQVVQADNAQPVAGAQVHIPGTEIGMLTNEEGRYRLTGVPAGQVEVNAQLIGYRPASQTVTVQAGQTATANFEIEQTALRLQELVVTGVSEATPRVKLPFTVDQVNTADVPVPASDPISLLAGKAPGIQVVRGSGQPGDAASVQLRGITSVDARGRSNEPLIIIDGVVQGSNASLADINTLDIESMEVVKGAAASSMYGSRASNGVIQITTKTGESMSEGTFDLMVRNEYGRSWLAGDIALAEKHPYQLTESGDAFVLSGAPSECGNASADYTACGGGVMLNPTFEGDGPTEARTFQDKDWPGETYDQLDRFYEPGDSYSNYAAVSGRLENTSFRGSFENFRELGVVDGHAGFTRRNARLNLDSPLSEAVNLSATAFYSHSNQDDIGAGGPFFSLTFMPVGADLLREDEDGELLIQPDPNAVEPNPIYDIRHRASDDFRDRIMGSFTADWQATQAVTLETSLSFDRSQLEQVNFVPIGVKDIETPEGGPGGASRSTFWERAVNGTVTASLAETFLDEDLTTRLRARYLFEDQHRESTGASGSQFAVEGISSLGALQGDLSINSFEQDERAQAVSLSGTLDLKDRYIFDGVVRRDGSSLFGADERWHTYGRASFAYRPSMEPWWFAPDALSEFKLQASYGTSGGRPNWSAQFETFSVGGSGNVSPGQLGNNDLKPELAKEIELGVRMVMFNRHGLDITYAKSEVEDQILDVPLPAFAGFNSQWQNAGTVDTETWEVSVNPLIVDRSDMTWSMRVSADHIEQVMTELNVPPFRWGSQGRFLYQEGEEIGNFYGARWASSCSELPEAADCSEFQVNDDGYLVWTGGESFRNGISNQLWGTSTTIDGATYDWGTPFSVGDLLQVGNNQPDWNLSVSSNFRYGSFTLYGLFTASLDYDLYNNTRQWAYRDDRSGDVDQADKPEGLKKPISYYQRLYNTNSSSGHFVEDGSYGKLRELSLSYRIPSSVLSSVFGGAISQANFNLIGRNLLVVTDYSGYDPEVGASGGVGGSAAVGRLDAWNFPNFPTFTGALELTF